MELQTVETVVRRLFSDDEFRASAMADATQALSEYDLGSNERAALVSLCDRMSTEEIGAGPLVFWF